jgi:hypothetical protein
MDEKVKEALKYINETPELQSMLYDVNLLPEQTLKDPLNLVRTLLITHLHQRAAQAEKISARRGVIS